MNLHASPARTRSRGPPGHRRPDRRREIRHHVPVAGAADHGLHVVAVADLNVERAQSQLATAGWPAEQYAAASLDDAVKQRAHPRHRRRRGADRAPRHRGDRRGDRHPRGRHRPCASKRSSTASTSSWSTSRPTRWPARLLARKAKAAGVVYSLAWGDQPALICEHVDWARACGFKVIAAGKGTRYEPHYHKSNPDNVWDILDKYLNISDRKSINPKMFNSFVDGTKSGIEMTAVCNATGLVAADRGLGLSAGDALRARRRLQAEKRGRHAGEGGRHRSHLVGLSRRHATCRIISRSAPTS